MKKTEAWLWIGGAFLAGAVIGALTGLPGSVLGGWQGKFAIPGPINP